MMTHIASLFFNCTPKTLSVYNSNIALSNYYKIAQPLLLWKRNSSFFTEASATKLPVAKGAGIMGVYIF